MNPPLNEYAGPVVVSSIATNSDDHHVLTLRRLSDHLFEIESAIKDKNLQRHKLREPCSKLLHPRVDGGKPAVFVYHQDFKEKILCTWVTQISRISLSASSMTHL